MPTISIIVPVYKVEQWLPRCVDSILAQTYTDFECILVDDGSPDNCGKICDEYAGKDSRVVVIHQKNSGVSAARNAGLARAKGDWLAFCDSDDCMAQGLLAQAVALQQQHPAAMVSWGYTSDWGEFCAHQNDTIACTTQRYSEFIWRSGYTPAPWVRLYHGQTVRGHSLRFDESISWAEDYYFNADYFAARHPSGDFDVLLSTQPFYYYFCDNPNSLTQEHDKQTQKKEVHPPKQGFCSFLLAEYAQQAPLAARDLRLNTQKEFATHYLRSFAFAVYSADALGEALPKGFFASSAIQELLRCCKANKIYSIYYLPFRLKSKRLIARLFIWDETKSAAYYRTQLLLGKGLFRSWNK